MACFIGFAKSKVVSVGVGVSVLSQRVFILPTATECLLSISDSSETIASMKAALPNMALGCVTSTSVTISQNVLPNSAEHSVRILSVLLPPDTPPEETTYSRFEEDQSSAVAYPELLFGRGGVQQIQLRAEDRENGNLGATAL